MRLGMLVRWLEQWRCPYPLVMHAWSCMISGVSTTRTLA